MCTITRKQILQTYFIPKQDTVSKLLNCQHKLQIPLFIKQIVMETYYIIIQTFPQNIMYFSDITPIIRYIKPKSDCNCMLSILFQYFQNYTSNY